MRKRHKAAEHIPHSSFTLDVGPSENGPLSTFNRATGNELLEATNANAFGQPHGFLDINNLTNYSGVPTTSGFANVWDFASFDGTTTPNGFNSINDFRGFDPAPEEWDVNQGYIGANELGNFDIVPIFNELTHLNGLIGPNESANANNLGPAYMPAEIEPGVPLHQNITPMWLVDNQATDTNNFDNLDNLDSFAGLEGFPGETMFPDLEEIADPNDLDNFGGQSDLGQFDFMDFTNM